MAETFREQKYPDHGFYAAWGDYSGYPKEVSPLKVADLFNLAREFGDIQLLGVGVESRICTRLATSGFVVEASCSSDYENVKLLVLRTTQPVGEHMDMPVDVMTSRLVNDIDFSWSGNMTSGDFEGLIDEIRQVHSSHVTKQD